MEIISGMFKNLLAFAYQNNISFDDTVRLMDYVILTAEIDTDKEWDLAKLLECQKCTNSILRMYPMNQLEAQYNVYKPSYATFMEEPHRTKAYVEYKVKNYKANYKHIVTMAEEYKKTIIADG